MSFRILTLQGWISTFKNLCQYNIDALPAYGLELLRGHCSRNYITKLGMSAIQVACLPDTCRSSGAPPHTLARYRFVAQRKGCSMVVQDVSAREQQSRTTCLKLPSDVDTFLGLKGRPSYELDFFRSQDLLTPSFTMGQERLMISVSSCSSPPHTLLQASR